MQPLFREKGQTAKFQTGWERKILHVLGFALEARDYFFGRHVHNYSFDIFFFLSEANRFEVLFWASTRVTCPRDRNRDVTEVSFL